MPLRRYGPAVIVSTIVLLAASCRGGGRATNSVTATTAPTGSSSTTAATAAAATAPPTTSAVLRSQAAAAVFQAGDFPGSFSAQADQGGACPDSSSSCASLNIETVWHDLTGCLGVDDSKPDALATSPTYLQGLATQARSTVEYTSESSSAAIAAAVSGPKFQGCATTAFAADAKRSAPQGATPGPSTVSPLPAPSVGQKVSASRILVTMDLQGLTIKIVQDFLVVFNGRSVTRMFFLNPGGPFPPNLEKSLVQAVVTRAGT